MGNGLIAKSQFMISVIGSKNPLPEYRIILIHNAQYIQFHNYMAFPVRFSRIFELQNCAFFNINSLKSMSFEHVFIW